MQPEATDTSKTAGDTGLPHATAQAQPGEQEELPYVIMELAECKYGLSSGHVREMLVLPEITPMQKVSEYIRGVINLRGKVVPVVDLRVRLGLPPFATESAGLIDMLKEREQEHVKWVDELEASVKEDREFKGEKDPTRCAFGQWYQQFTSNNQLLSMQLKKFDAPHRTIHNLAHHVAELRAANDHEQAAEVVKNARDRELAELQHLFETTYRLVEESSREIALVLEQAGRLFAISVDAVATVERIRPETIEEPPPLPRGSGEESPVVKLARRSRDDEVVSIIDPARILSSDVVQAAEAVPTA